MDSSASSRDFGTEKSNRDPRRDEQQGILPLQVMHQRVRPALQNRFAGTQVQARVKSVVFRRTIR